MAGKKLSQFERRKLKEKETLSEVVEKRDKIREQKKVKNSLTNVGFDVIMVNGKYNLVVLKYNPEIGLAEVEKVIPIRKNIGMPFLQKKEALTTLISSLYKLI